MGKVLGIQSKRGLYKLVGASLPLRVSSYLNLYGAAKGLSKTDILRPIIEGWIDKQQQKESDEGLMQEIIQRIESRWKIERNYPSMTLEVFKNNISQELQMKDIPDEYIKIILNEIV